MLEISGVGAVMAFLAGLVSFLSPSVLPLVPGYVRSARAECLDHMLDFNDGHLRRVPSTSFTSIIGVRTDRSDNARLVRRHNQ